MKAVIRDGSKQFIVAEGQEIEIERNNLELKSTYNFEVLSIIKDDGETVVGTPIVKDAVVEGKVIRQNKMKKIIVFFYRKRKGSSKKKGHRQKKMLVRISKVAM